MDIKNGVSKKEVYIFLSVLLLSFLILIVFIHNDVRRVRSVEIRQSNQAKIIWNIDEIRNSRSEIIISGWAFKPGTKIKTVDTHILLQNINNGKYYEIPTVFIRRPDVSKAYKKEDKYNLSGFLAVIKKNQLSSPLSHYRVYIHYENNKDNQLVDTGYALVND